MPLRYSTRTTNRFWTGVSLLLALHMLTTPFAVYLRLVDRGPTWLGLDDSARMTLNYAWTAGLDWGHEMVYTYGPLSFLSTKVGWGISGWVFWAIDLFVVANFAAIFRDFILRATIKPLAAAAVFLLTLAVPLFYGSGLAWVLLAANFFWMYRSLQSPRWYYFALLAALIAIAFYLKLNTGLFAIVFLLGHLFFGILARRISYGAAGGTLVALAVLIWGGATVFHVSLPAYVKGAVEVVKGYNDLLYLYEEHPVQEGVILALFFGLCGLFAAAAVPLLRQKKFGAAYLLLLAVGYLYLLKKQALFRNDRQHLEEFFAYAPLVLFTGAGVWLPPRWRTAALAGTAAVAGLCAVAGLGDRPLPLVGERVLQRYTVVPRYFREAAAYHRGDYPMQPEKRHLPPRILQRIGRGTVDVVPWDANYALQNGLAYTPRPCFQTFQANSDYLQRINLRFFEQRGPRFVLYDYDAIDGAYPFNDAPTLNLFLARAYTVADSFTSNERWRILLERKAGTASPVRLQAAGAAEASLNQSIPVIAPYLKLEVSYTLTGKLKALWDKPSPLQIAYQTADGAWHPHKTSPELLKTGIYTGRHIRSNEDFARFVSGDTASLPAIRAVKLVGEEKHYRSAVRVQRFTVY